ncbi:MAG TPA: hypothetical protein VIC57_06155 [Candidatus Dormibacteraeota bacterium]|jgi:hypothetical protein
MKTSSGRDGRPAEGPTTALGATPLEGRSDRSLPEVRVRAARERRIRRFSVPMDLDEPAVTRLAWRN